MCFFVCVCVCVCVCVWRVCGECACTRECTLCVSACASTRGLQHKFISQLPFTFPFYGMQQHATTRRFQALKSRKPLSVTTPPLPRSTRACSELTDNTTHVPGKKKSQNKVTRQGFSVLHEPVKTQRKRVLCSHTHKKKVCMWWIPSTWSQKPLH